MHYTMATREQLQAAAIQCVNYEQQLLNHQSVVQLAIQRLQENAIAIDDLLSKMDDGDSVEWSSLHTITDEIKTLIAFTHQYRPSLRSVLQKLQEAIKRADIQSFDKLLQDERITSYNLTPLFSYACNKANVAMVQRLAQDSRFVVSANNRETLIVAAKQGHLDIVNCILQFTTIDPSLPSFLHNTNPLIMASAHGHLAVVDRLLQDERVDPSALNNKAIKDATRCNHLPVIKRLMQDARCTSHPVINNIFIAASRNGHLSIIEWLIQESPRWYHNRDSVDERTNLYCAIRYASEIGNLAIIDLLLQTTSVDPSGENNYVIQAASTNGHLAVVNRLLQDSRVDPSACNNYAIIRASQYGHLAVVDRLLQDSRVNPSDNDNKAIKHAEARGFTEIVELLKLHGCSL